MRLVIGTVVASIPPDTDVGQLTMSGTFCCFSSPGLLTFYDWSVKSSLVVSLSSDNMSLIGLCCCQSKSREARRVFGLTSDGRILCWRYDTEFNSVPCNHIYAYNDNDWPRNVTVDVAYLIADETSDLLVIVIPNRFLHVFSLRLNKMVGMDTLVGDADNVNLVRSSLRLQFKPLQHYSRSSSDAVCNMWGLTDIEGSIEEITICLGTETFLDIWKIDILTEDRIIANNNDTPSTLAERQAVKDAGSKSTMRIPTKHNSWITAISSKISTVVPLEKSTTNSIVITGDASGGVIVWLRKNLRHSVIRENWLAEKKAREDEAKAVAAALAQAEKLRAAALVTAAQRDIAINSTMNSRNSSVIAPRSRTPSKHGGSRSRSPNKIGSASGPTKQGLANWNIKETIMKEVIVETEQEPIKSATETSRPGSSRKGKRNSDAEAKEETPGPTEPDDLTVSGLDEHIVLIDFGASGPITVIFIDSSLELVWIADASGAITGATLDLTQRSLVKTRRLVADLGWASELFWQRDEVTKHGIVRYVEKNRGVVMEWILHDKVTKVFQAASELDAPAAAGHRSLITCCTLLPDWGLLLTGGFDPTIDVWDIRQGQLVCTLEVPSKRLSSMALQTIAVTDAENKDERDANLCSPIARLVTGHSSGDMHSFRLSLITSTPPKISASLAHTSTYSPMPVTDIVLSCKGTVAALCFGRLCIILHDCETNRSLRELNFEAPLDCIQSVDVSNIAIYTASLMSNESSSFYGSRNAALSRLGAKSPMQSKSRVATSVAASRGVSNRSQLKNRRDDQLVVALQSKRVAKVIDLLGSGEAITSLDLGNHAKNLEPYSAIQGFVWQTSPTNAELVGVFVSQQENVLNYLPDVVCFRKQIMSSGDTETFVVPAPTVVMLSAERRLGIDPVDAIAGGLQVTHLTWADTTVTLAAVWSMRKVFFIQTVSFSTAEKQQEDARVIHVCYVPDRKVHVVFAKVLQNYSSDLSISSSSVIFSSPPVIAVGDGDTQVSDTDSMLPTIKRRASAIVVLSDGHTMTLNLDID